MSCCAGDNGGGGLSGGAWAGIGIGIAAAMVLAALALFLLVRRRRRRQRRHPGTAGGASALQLQRRSDVSIPSSTADKGVGPRPSVELLRRQQLDAGFNSVLRLRFGGLEGLEIGALIGRGAYGRWVGASCCGGAGR